jgi:predicted dehydrogenase
MPIASSVTTVGVVGYGYWGPNLVRNFAELPDARVVRVSDLRPDRLGQVTARYPTTKVGTSANDVIGDPSVDAVVIATPVHSHFELGMAALRSGKHVWIEKPLAATSDEAARLLDEADRRGLALMVDHTFVFAAAVQKMRELTRAGELGDIQYYDSVRINLGHFQNDVNVLWDLAVHDLSIMDCVLENSPVAVSATGLAHIAGSPENLAYLTMFFDATVIGHVHVNWLAPVKIRRTLLGGTRRMLVFDDLEASDKIKIYDRGISVNGSADKVALMRIGYRMGDMWSPQLALREPLHAAARHFIDVITAKAAPMSDGHAGLRIVKLLEAASQSLACQGRPISVGGGTPI